MVVRIIIVLVLGLVLVGLSFRKRKQAADAKQRWVRIMRYLGVAIVFVAAFGGGFVALQAGEEARVELTPRGARASLSDGKLTATFPGHPERTSFRTGALVNTGFVLSLDNDYVNLRLIESRPNLHLPRMALEHQVRSVLSGFGELQELEDDGTFMHGRVRIGPDGGVYRIMDIYLVRTDLLRRIVAVYPEDYEDMAMIEQFLRSAEFMADDGETVLHVPLED